MEFFGIIYLSFVLLKICGAHNLVAVEAKVKLPEPSTGHVAIYDDEYILVLGGHNGSFPGEIGAVYSYSIEEDSIVRIANFPNGIGYGLATFDKESDVYYIGGINASGYSYDIFKLDVRVENLTIVGQLSDIHIYGAAINSNIDENKTLLFGAIKDEVTCFDLNILTTCGRKSLLGRYTWNFAAFEHDNYAYAFGDDRSYSIEKINLETMESVLIEGFGFQLFYPGVVSGGTFGYIIGGYFASDAGIPVDGIIRYDPRTNEHTFLPVENFPVTGTDRWYNGAAVYVEKLDRIYIIGGIINDVGKGYHYQDKIFYIDLHPNVEEPSSTRIPIPTTTMNPDIFNCEQKPNGMFPNPYDCAKFIGCHDEVMEVCECPAPLLFNPIILTCTLEEDVDCSINCSDKPNGMYPHPHSCDLFIICHDEVVEVYKCPEPLLFHPKERKCTFPEEVSCNIK